MKVKIKKIIFISLGITFTFFGLIGIFIPLLPTTPFLLLAAFFYLRSSGRLYNWLLNNKILGRFIYNYIKHKAVAREIKISTIIILWISLSLSAYFLKNLYLAILLLFIGIGVTMHLLMLKTYIPNEDKNNL